MKASSITLLAGLTMAISSTVGAADNPILGKWKGAKGGVIAASDVEFTPTEQINGPREHYPVKYQVDGDIVTVIPQKSGIAPRKCKLRDADTLDCNAFGAAMAFTRAK